MNRQVHSGGDVSLILDAADMDKAVRNYIELENPLIEWEWEVNKVDTDAIAVPTSYLAIKPQIEKE